jgi:hypothetical protein
VVSQVALFKSKIDDYILNLIVKMWEIVNLKRARVFIKQRRTAVREIVSVYVIMGPGVPFTLQFIPPFSISFTSCYRDFEDPAYLSLSMNSELN